MGAYIEMESSVSQAALSLRKKVQALRSKQITRICVYYG